MASSEKDEISNFLLFRESTKDKKIVDFCLSGVAQMVLNLTEALLQSKFEDPRKI